MSTDTWTIRLSSGDEHILNKKRYDAFKRADTEGVRFLHISDTLSINMAFVEKVWKNMQVKNTYKDYERDERAAPEKLQEARKLLEEKLFLPSRKEEIAG